MSARWVAAGVAAFVIAACGCDYGDGNAAEQRLDPAKRAAVAEAQKRADRVVLALSGVAGLKETPVIKTVAQERAGWIAHRRAGRVALKLSDFPDSWRKAPRASEWGGSGLAKCFGIDHSGHVPIGYWESPAFLTKGTKVVSTVWTYATEAEAAGAELRAWRGLRKILDNYRPGRAPAADCVMSLFSEGGDYRVKAEVGDYSVYLVPCSDGCQSWRVTIRVRGKGSSATAFVDTHIHRHGDTVVEMRTRRVRKPFAGVTGQGRELQDHLLQTLIDRMVAAAGR